MNFYFQFTYTIPLLVATTNFLVNLLERSGAPFVHYQLKLRRLFLLLVWRLLKSC